MRGNIFSSQGLESLLHIINPNGAAEGSRLFPNNIVIGDTNYSNSFANANEWLVHCVDTVLGGEIERFLLEDSMGAFVEVKWMEHTYLRYLNIQVIISEGSDLTTSYCERIDNCQYFRLDLDLEKCGSLFREPMPHIHSKGKDEPRFPFNIIVSENLIIDFFSLVYRNYFYDKWKKWLYDSFADLLQSRLDEDNTFEVICEAYKAGKIDIVNQVYLKEVGVLKEITKNASNNFFRIQPHQMTNDLFI